MAEGLEKLETWLPELFRLRAKFIRYVPSDNDDMDIDPSVQRVMSLACDIGESLLPEDRDRIEVWTERLANAFAVSRKSTVDSSENVEAVLRLIDFVFEMLALRGKESCDSVLDAYKRARW